MAETPQPIHPIEQLYKFDLQLILADQENDPVGYLSALEGLVSLEGTVHNHNASTIGLTRSEDFLRASSLVNGQEELTSRLLNLVPISNRGLVGGSMRSQVIVSDDDPWALELEFEGDDPAIVYARSEVSGGIRLLIREKKTGAVICDRAPKSGSPYCFWEPTEQASYTAEIHGRVRTQNLSVDLFTN